MLSSLFAERSIKIHKKDRQSFMAFQRHFKTKKINQKVQN